MALLKEVCLLGGGILRLKKFMSSSVHSLSHACGPNYKSYQLQHPGLPAAMLTHHGCEGIPMLWNSKPKQTLFYEFASVMVFITASEKLLL